MPSTTDHSFLERVVRKVTRQLAEPHGGQASLDGRWDRSSAEVASLHPDPWIYRTRVESDSYSWHRCSSMDAHKPVLVLPFPDVTCFMGGDEFHVLYCNKKTVFVCLFVLALCVSQTAKSGSWRKNLAYKFSTCFPANKNTSLQKYYPNRCHPIAISSFQRGNYCPLAGSVFQ
jgi:hypothetical protein